MYKLLQNSCSWRKEPEVILFQVVSLLVLLHATEEISSPIIPNTPYNYSIEIKPYVADLFWNINEETQEITFELHANTIGWIALGISPSGGMAGADIGVGWISQSGTVYFEDRYASDTVTPIIDNTTQDWFALEGHEENGWTAIQFKRLFDTCDTMDVPIKSGTNNLIFAYGLIDPITDITYHEMRQSSRTLSLRSYKNPPSSSKYEGIEYFDFRLKNYSIPRKDTTYYCKICKVPNVYSSKRHAIATEFLIDPINKDFIHHILLYECDRIAVFNDSQLPEGNCNKMSLMIQLCRMNIANGWAVGADYIFEYPEDAGYPVGDDFEIQYYLIEVHYNNPQLKANLTDSSGVRFYVGDELRKYDIGSLTLGMDIMANSITIPPRTQSFIIDSFCPSFVTAGIPSSGINVITAFPHAHLQGRSISTKIIRNSVAQRYLFNGDPFNFDYQFSHRLPEQIKIYPNDEFVTRCIYSTMNKVNVTLGGESVLNEMCLHIFTYYPRVSTMSICVNALSTSAWLNFADVQTSRNPTYSDFVGWLLNISWTPQRVVQWQTFYNEASRYIIAGRSANATRLDYGPIPPYTDLKLSTCQFSSSAHRQVICLITMFLITLIIRMMY